MSSAGPGQRKNLKGSRLPLASLGDLERVGAGGQANIYRPSQFPGLLYKQYNSPDKVDGRALDQLRRLRLRLAAADRDFLDQSAAWPAILVEDSPCTVGFLMAPAADRFFHDFGRAGSKPQDLQYLIHKPKAAWKAIALPGPFERLEICAQIAHAVDLMHRNRVVVGDISMSNILWTLDPGPGIYLIDCDGVRPAGGTAVLDQTNTPDWADPADPSRATFDTDRYKLALAVMRILAVEPYFKPGSSAPVIPSLSKVGQHTLATLVAQIDLSVRTRPEASDWLAALESVRSCVDVS